MLDEARLAAWWRAHVLTPEECVGVKGFVTSWGVHDDL
jgi:hypothetical protein